MISIEMGGTSSPISFPTAEEAKEWFAETSKSASEEERSCLAGMLFDFLLLGRTTLHYKR